MIYSIFWLVEKLIGLYIDAVIAMVIVSLLISFDVINGRSQFVYQINVFLDRLTAPALTPIRRALPHFGNVDISPVILIIVLEAIQLYALPDIFGLLSNAGLAF